MAKMAASIVETGEDAFRKIFKLYKRRNPPPDFSDVIDFSKCVTTDKIVPVKLDPAAVSDGDAAKVGLRPVKDWKAFNLQGYPGFIFITNPFLRGSQLFWVRQCLKIYPQKPNVCNLDMHMSPIDTQDIWDKSVPNLRHGQKTLQPQYAIATRKHATSRRPGNAHGVKIALLESSKSTERATSVTCRGSSPSVGKREPRTLLERLRWVTLGYHYNWTSKTYSANHCTPFPTELHLLSYQIATACGFPGFIAQAGILNYYKSDSSLGIHVDESELDHSRPLLSFSFGQSAIFLLGGTHRQDTPTAMYMHSGDLMVMSGQSRLFYHAVPRIVPTHRKVEALETDRCGWHSGWQGGAVVEQVSEEDWAVCARYIHSSRINMTVRQVLGEGQSFPETPPLPGHPEVRQEDDEDRMKRRRKSDSFNIKNT
ncbi:nucleic acid dioxygenase ALKBH1 isoform X1 [Phycodurus eques]|uniref:nucleic acid dioxygenase ALKBH1 isoform X1 n=1 Tax=Phycodurus eques TaxID=693459 RepID=UPI002ACD31A8|nr:nucleic acid dioxygenase ALKBH1 isoform X1 [Phycodurus eques]